MRFWRTVLVLTLATLWVAAGEHCRLEMLSGFEFLSCCQHEEAEKAPAHHENDCDDDACTAVEQGFYKQARPQQPLLKPLLKLVAWLIPLADETEAERQGCLVRVASSPPELSRVWLFLQRAALPPRAPSFVS
jgi:hypothetical protein